MQGSISSPRRPTSLDRFRELMNYRELLRNLIKKDLKVRYQDSVLGFAWSMLNPILYLVVFYLVFNLFLPGGIPYFPVFLLSGLLPWTMFSTALAGGTGSVVGGGPLLKKVYFPRQVLPLASIGAAMFHLALQMIVLLAFLVIFRYPFVSEFLLLVPYAILVELLVLIGFTLLLSAANVYLRDIQHFLDLTLLAWFWMTPIVYQVALVRDRLAPRGLFSYYLVNPMTPIVLSFQRAFYNRVSGSVRGERVQVLLDQPLGWYFEKLTYVGAFGLLLIAIGSWAFGRLEGNFAEAL